MRIHEATIAAFLFLAVDTVPAQVTDWQWPAQSEYPFDYTAFEKNTSSKGSRTLLAWAVGYYRARVSPLQGMRCPFHPSCSVYTLYCMQKYGTAAGFIMCIERLYIKETPRISGYRKIVIGEKELLYDPPEANAWWASGDWRTSDPYYYRLFYCRDRQCP